MSKNTRVPESPVIWELIFSDGSKRLYQEPHTCIINHDNTLRRTKKQPGCGQWKWSISLDVAPFPVTVTTKIITFLEGILNYSKTLFATGILEKGPHLTSCFQRIKKHPQRRKPHKTRRFFLQRTSVKKNMASRKIWKNMVKFAPCIIPKKVTKIQSSNFLFWGVRSTPTSTKSIKHPCFCCTNSEPAKAKRRAGAHRTSVAAMGWFCPPEPAA